MAYPRPSVGCDSREASGDGLRAHQPCNAMLAAGVSGFTQIEEGSPRNGGRRVLARGVFTSLPDLARKIRRYIARYNDDPKPIRWTYSNPAHRITTDSAVTVH